MRLRNPRLHQAIDLIDQRERLAGPGRHRDQHLSLAVSNRPARRRHSPRSDTAAAMDDRLDCSLTAPCLVASPVARRSVSAAGVWKCEIRRDRLRA